MTDEQTLCGYCDARDAITDLRTTTAGGGRASLHRGPHGEIAAQPACSDCLALGRHQYQQKATDRPRATQGGHYKDE